MKNLENMTLEELYKERCRVLSRVTATLTIMEEVRQIDKVIEEKKLKLINNERKC